jgi:hypothetical protein
MGISDTRKDEAGPSVLEDPTGRRARWMRRAGRVVFVLFLAWLLAVVLGGLGLMPVAGIPLTHVLRPSQGPPPLAKLPTPKQPASSDLRPAIPARVFAAKTAAAVHRAALAKRATHVKGSVARGQTKKTSTVSGKAVAPGQVKKTPTVRKVHGKKTVLPARRKRTTTVPTTHGKSATARGRTKTATTSTTTTPSSTKSVGHAKKP